MIFYSLLCFQKHANAKKKGTAVMFACVLSAIISLTCTIARCVEGVGGGVFMWGLLIVWSQKTSILPPQGVIGNSTGEGVSKANIFKGKYQPKLEFPEGKAVLSISTDDRRKASAISLREIGYFSPKLK